MISADFANGTSTQYTYDKGNNLTNLVNKSGSNTISSYNEWDYKQKEEWRVPQRYYYNGHDMSVDNNRNWYLWIYFDGELIAGDDFGNINLAYIGYILELPEYVYVNFATTDGKDAKTIQKRIDLAKEGR